MAHILVVDDEPEVLNLVAKLRGRHQGVRVSTARRAAAARAVLMSDAVDLMITDAHMPGENGVALARAAAELGIPAPASAARRRCDAVLRSEAALARRCLGSEHRLAATARSGACRLARRLPHLLVPRLTRSDRERCR